MKNIMMIVVACLGWASIILAQAPPSQWPPPSPPVEFPEILVSNGWLADGLATDAVAVLDVREAKDYEAGHVPQALPGRLPAVVARQGVESLQSRLAALGLSGTETVVVYGATGDAEIIGRLFWLLEWAGHIEVKVLAGGFEGWVAEGREIRSGPAIPRAGDFAAPHSDAVCVTAEWVDDGYGKPGVEVLDLRDARVWPFEGDPPIFAAGHVPHALTYDFRQFFTETGSWPDPAAVRERLDELGPRPGDPVNLFATFVLYGENALEPQLGLGYLTLKVAGIQARIFAGGFERWRELDLPIVQMLSLAQIKAFVEKENPALDKDVRPKRLALIDVREARDFAMLGHIPGAYHLGYRLGFSEIFEAVFAYRWPGQPRATTPVLFYCYGWDCVRSRKAATAISRVGFKNLYIYRGGIAEWEAPGYPLFESPLVP